MIPSKVVFIAAWYGRLIDYFSSYWYSGSENGYFFIELNILRAERIMKVIDADDDDMRPLIRIRLQKIDTKAAELYGSL